MTEEAPPRLPHVVIHTDGACSGNPGPGGWGAILSFGDHEKELKGGEANTTNNRMELMAAISALEALTRARRGFQSGWCSSSGTAFHLKPAPVATVWRPLPKAPWPE